MLYIGVGGLFCAGKDTVAEYLRNTHGFELDSCSNRIRALAKHELELLRGKPGVSILTEDQQAWFSEHVQTDPLHDDMIDRDGQGKFGDCLRNQFGSDALAQFICKRIREEHIEKCVITSIRTPGEVEFFKNNLPNFMMFFVDADPEVRYNRAKARGSEKDRVDRSQFFAVETKESTGNNTHMNHELVRKAADHVLMNDGDVEALHKKIDGILANNTF